MPQNPVPSTLFVTKIIAGVGISITPVGGTGIVTISTDHGDYNPAAVAITGGTIDGVVIGGTTPKAVTATKLTAVGAPGTGAGAGDTQSITGGAGGPTDGAGGPADLIGGAGTGAGNGGAAVVKGGASGAGATGNGGPADVTGGDATSTNGNGGSVVNKGGAHAGTGVDGMIIDRSVKLVHQGAATAKTVSATLTAAEVQAGIITVNQGGAGASALQLPLATAMDTAFPDAAANDAFDFSLINISAVAAESASLTTNTGWTLVGDMDVSANSAATTKSAGRFRAAKTGAGAWTLFRLS